MIWHHQALCLRAPPGKGSLLLRKRITMRKLRNTTILPTSDLLKVLHRLDQGSIHRTSACASLNRRYLGQEMVSTPILCIKPFLPSLGGVTRQNKETFFVLASRSSAADFFVAFILYRQHHQQAIIARNPGLNNPDISKIIGEQWKAEGEESKKVWQDLALVRFDILYPKHF